jgi:predicted permease
MSHPTPKREPSRLPLAAELWLWIIVPAEYRNDILGDLREAYWHEVRVGVEVDAKRQLWKELLSPHLLALRHEARTLRSRRRRTFIGRFQMRTVLKDFQYASRTLRRSPVFTLVAVVTLGLSIGANTAIFSFVNGVLLRPLPYRAPEQLVFVWDRLAWIGIPRAWIQASEVPVLRNEATLFEGFAAMAIGSSQLTGGGEPEQLSAGLATADLFDLLGVSAALGRTFLPGDDIPGAPRVAVLSYGLWNRRFGGDPGVIGRAVTLDGELTTIVGVLPRYFNFMIHSSLGPPRGAEIWQPYRVELASVPRGNHSLAVLGRIKDGFTFAQAEEELAAIGRRQDAEFWDDLGFSFTPVPVHGDLVKQVRPTLWVLLAAVGFILFIACANIATLMMARAQQREREVAVRRALGASRARIMWQAFLEGGVLASLGGALGLTLAILGMDALVALAPEALPRREDIAIDHHIFAFTGLASLMTGLLCGLAPALQSSNPHLVPSLREAGRGTVGLGRRKRVRNSIVVAEVALSLVLTTGAGLLVRSFALMQRADTGFDGEGVLAFNTLLPRSRYPNAPERLTFFHELIERVAGLPGVTHVGATSSLPLSGSTSQTAARPDVADEEEEPIFVDWVRATPEYFSALGIELLSGRAFTTGDHADAQPVAVIDESLARAWPNSQATGNKVFISGGWRTVVGVVRHARLYRIFADDRPQVYMPLAQAPTRAMTVTIRAGVDPANLTAAVRSEIAQIDANQPIYSITTMEKMTGDSLAERRFAMLLMAGFAVTAMLLASLGIYGVLAYLVAHRTHEIGVRVALGAKQGSVIRTVVRQGLTLAAVGIGVGLAGAFALSRTISSMVYGISATDPLTFAAVPMILIGVAAAACYVPAWRASKIDPMVALRHE